MTLLKSIKLRIAEKLKDKGYRREFFRGLAEDEVAQQIRSLRKKRGLLQKDIAEQTGMKQSAVSRLEQAEYSRWGFPTLLRIANTLDARIRIIFEPAEDVIKHYERLEAASEASPATGLQSDAHARVRAAQFWWSRQIFEFAAKPKGIIEEVARGQSAPPQQLTRFTRDNSEKRLHETRLN